MAMPEAQHAWIQPPYCELLHCVEAVATHDGQLHSKFLCGEDVFTTHPELCSIFFGCRTSDMFPPHGVCAKCCGELDV